MEDGSNNKTSAYIQLGIGILFIIILIVVAQLSGGNTDENISQNETKEEIKEVALDEKLAKITDNYKYNYEITIGDITYIYNGSKMGLKESGYLQINDNYLYYYKDNNYTYEVKNGGLFQIDNLYSNIDANYIDIEYIKNLIKDHEYTKEDNKYTYNLENIQIIIDTSGDNIISIQIKNENNYKLEYSEIGSIKEINY